MQVSIPGNHKLTGGRVLNTEALGLHVSLHLEDAGLYLL